MKQTKWQAGTNTHQVHVGDGVGTAALLISVGAGAVFLVGLPKLWVFLAGAAVLGAGFAAVLQRAPLAFLPRSLKLTNDDKQPL